MLQLYENLLSFDLWTLSVVYTILLVMTITYRVWTARGASAAYS